MQFVASSLLADLGDYWVIIAMVFIAFFRWLIFERRGVSQTEIEDDDDADELEFEPSSPPPLPEGIPDRPVQDTASELRRFLQEMSGQTPTKPPPPVARPQPPPVTRPQPPPEPTIEFTAEEQDALDALEQHQKAAQRPSSARSQALSLSLQAMLSDPESIKKAVMLKEILDRPVALRDRPW